MRERLRGPSGLSPTVAGEDDARVAKTIASLCRARAAAVESMAGRTEAFADAGDGCGARVAEAEALFAGLRASRLSLYREVALKMERYATEVQQGSRPEAVASIWASLTEEEASCSLFPELDALGLEAITDMVASPTAPSLLASFFLGSGLQGELTV